MDWKSFGKRLAVIMIICIILSSIITLLIFQVWTPWSFSVITLYVGVFLLIFGACLQTPFVEALATARYAVNPLVTRDTARHYSDRRSEQSSSGVVILVAGVCLILIGVIGLLMVPNLPS